MQRDTALTFGDIHGSKEALLASVKEIESLALVQEPEGGEPLKLRLLEIPDSQPDDNTFTLKLTNLVEPQPGQEWVSVSYCWTHSEPPSDRPIPNYQILASSNNPWRKPEPSCPITVLHRAVRFAQSRKCRYIWIDQENINQNDPIDMENHLQVMHRIYSDSRWTIAVLSYTIPSQSILEALSVFPTTDQYWNLYRNPALDPQYRALQYIIADRWFKRAWTFQERYCAKSLEFLIPISHRCTAVKELCDFTIDTDICVSPQFFSQQIFRHRLSATRDMEHAHGYNSLWFGFDHYFKEMQRISSAHIETDFKFLDECDISILADKLAIYGNIYKMTYKLKTTLLRYSGHSYSTCLLALVMAYHWPKEEERSAKYKEKSEKLLNYTFEGSTRVLALDKMYHRF